MSERKVITNDVKLKNGKYCYDWGGDETKPIKTINDLLKTYCFLCDKPTQTKNKRKEDLKEYQILKGECEECNKIKVSKKKYKQNPNDPKILLI